MFNWRRLRHAGWGAALLTCGVLVLPACGGDATDHEQAVREAFADFESNFQAGRGERACARLAEPAMAELLDGFSAGDRPQTCENVVSRVAEAAKDTEQHPSEILSVTVDGDRATASISDAGRDPVSVPFVYESGRWKLARLKVDGD